MPTIGQIGPSVAPMKMFTPWRKGSVFDCLMVTLRSLGLFLLSTEMSAGDRWVVFSYLPSAGIVNSPTLINPKNAI